MESSEQLGRLLPDIPRYVEARDLLLSGECEVHEAVTEPALAIVLRHAPDRAVFVIGRPTDEAVQEAVQANGDGGDVIGEPEQGDWLEGVLPRWKRSKIILHQLRDWEKLPPESDGKVRFVRADELDLEGMDAELAGELRAVTEFSLIAASFARGKLAAFCYCSAETEGQWDVSINTLKEHRRQGHAALAVAFMIRHQKGKGREPVWAAVAENPASWRLAEKLGFVQVDELVLFEKDKE